MEYWKTGRGVPNTYDKSLLFECRNSLDRNLSESERQVMRNSFRTFVEERVQEMDETKEEEDQVDGEYDPIDDSNEDDYDDEFSR